MSDIILSCKSLSKSYTEGPQLIKVIHDLSLDVARGKKIAIVGASGSGKSTLLNLLGGLDKPDTGEVVVNGQEFSSLDDNSRGNIRNKFLGFVYQFHHLLPEFTAIENVSMPLRIAGDSKKDLKEKSEYWLEKVGLSERASHKPAELSGGERQRVAIARALVNSPACVLMDEPTGNLDRKNAENIQALIADLSAQVQTSFIIVTHDEQVSQQLDQVYELNAGRLSVQ